jgi:hypothetical protein
MNSVNVGAAGRADPREALAGGGYGLLPAMIDGWLDAAPATVTFVDGNESAYLYNSPLAFLQAAVDIKGRCQELVSPENRAKYRAQVQVSSGIYLDAYWNPKTSPWYIDGQGGSRVDRLRANTAAALAAADQYVWVYGEQFRWWPTPNGGVKPQSWPEALPGSEQALRYARDPVDFARSEIAGLKAANKLVNLARNGAFGDETAKSLEETDVKWHDGAAPAGWNTWQDAASKGVFAWDRDTGNSAKGSARATGVGGGCLLQAYMVKPGERYAVRAVRKLQGRGEAHLRVRWQTAEGTWTKESQDVLLYASGPRDQWIEMTGVVEIPEGVGRLLILLGIQGQASPDDAAWFDDVELYRLP